MPVKIVFRLFIMKYTYAISRAFFVVVIARTFFLIYVWKQARASLIHTNLKCNYQYLKNQVN